MIKPEVLQGIQSLGSVITKSKEDKAKFEGGMEQIRTSFKSQFGIDNIDDMIALLEDLEMQYANKSEEVIAIYNELTSMFSW